MLSRYLLKLFGLFEVFRKNLFLSNLLLLPYTFLVRIHTMINPVPHTKGEDSGLLTELLLNAVTDPLTQNIIANVLIFIQALLINHIFAKNHFSKDSTLFAGVLYVLFCSLMADNNLLTPALLGATFIILALMYLLSTYKVPHATASIFNTGFMLAVASQFYIPYFSYILFGVVGMLILRSFKVLEKLQYIIGFFIPYFLVFTYKYWNDIPFAELDFLRKIFFRIPSISADQLIIFYVTFGVLMANILVSGLSYGAMGSKKSIQVQKKVDIIYWALLFSLVSFLVFRTVGVTHLITLSIPLSIITGTLVSESRNTLFNELMHIVLVALIQVAGFKLIGF